METDLSSFLAKAKLRQDRVSGNEDSKIDEAETREFDDIVEWVWRNLGG